jgi:hypothetical protein
MEQQALPEPSLSTYMRNAWGNRAPGVSIGQVQDLREQLTAESP